MAQAGFTPISLYFSSTASAVPTSGNLVDGEIALNTADMKLYAKNSAGTVTLLASSGGAAGTVSSVAVSGGTTGLTTSGGPITTSGTITLAGTLATANGGTNLTSFTSGGVVYASSSSALATGSSFTFDGSTLALTGVQTITNSGGSTLILDRTSNAGSLQLNFGGTQTGQVQAASGGGLIFYQGSTPTEGMRLTSTGLGIGTSSPTQKLTVNGSIDLPTVNTYIYGGGHSVLQVDATRTYFYGGTSGVQFRTSNNASQLVEITDVGAIGVGTSGSFGTAGQVLTSGGSGAAPTWSTPAGGGSQAFVAFGTSGGY
jgi:hypothetical protein